MTQKQDARHAVSVVQESADAQMERLQEQLRALEAEHKAAKAQLKSVHNNVVSSVLKKRKKVKMQNKKTAALLSLLP